MKSIKRNILLNPGPATTTDTVKYAMVVPDICPREKEFGLLVEEITEMLVQVVNGGDRYRAVIFAGSGTAAVDAVINSVIPQHKSLLVVSNGAYGARMVEIAQNYAIPVVKYDIEYGDYPLIDEVETLLKKHKGTISHLGIVHHETTTGMLNPIEDMLKLCRRYGIQIIVDTISSYAGIPIDLMNTDYDYIVSTSNKNIQGMAGLSFVIGKKELIESQPEQTPTRSYYLNLYQQHRFFSQHRQMQFTPPVQIFYALKQALKEYFSEGGKNRYLRYCTNWQTLVDGLMDLGFKLLLPLDQQSKLLTAVLEPSDRHYNFKQMHDFLLARDFTIYPGKGAKKSTFRVANIGQIFKDDIIAFLRALDQYIITHRIKEF
jgi:2-aminoethylphosphonate aminotransferase